MIKEMKIKTTIMIISAMILGIITIQPTWAWEEQLEGCRIRGIQPADCPDDESYVGVPYNPPPSNFSGSLGSSLRGSGGRTTYTKWVWVYTETTYYNPSEKICYNAYQRRIQYFKNNKTVVEDFPKVTKNECAKPYWHTINLVFNK